MIKRILVGLGGTSYTPVAIQHAVKLSKRFEAEVTGITVVDVKHLSNIGPVPVGGEHAADKLRRHRIIVTKERIEEAKDTLETESNPGDPKDFLLPMATLWQADMIVLGNSARNLLMKRLLGETALHIIRNADRPLFLCQ